MREIDKNWQRLFANKTHISIYYFQQIRLPIKGKRRKSSIHLYLTYTRVYKSWNTFVVCMHVYK